MNFVASMPKYEAYKDSRVKWLPKIPSDWKVLPAKRFHKVIKSLNNKKQCSDILSLTLRGVVNNNPDNPEGLVPKDYGSYQIFEKDDLVFKLIDLENLKTSRVGLVHQRGIMSPAYIRLEVGNDFVPKYVYYYYYDLYLNAVYNKLGAGVRSTLGPTDLLQIPMVQPSEDEQSTIANYIDRKTTQIDQAIAIKEKQIALLKERKQILIQNAVTRGLDPSVPMKDSGVEWVGEIPEHWKILANRALFQERVEPGKEELPLLSVSIHTGVSTEELSEEDNIRGRVKIADKSKYILVKENDITFNMMRAWQGGIGCVSVDGMVSPAYIVARPIIDLNSDYFEYQYRCPEFIQQMDRFSKGITDFRKRLYWNEFKQLLTVYPPKEEQDKIVAHIEAEARRIDKGISLQQAQIEKLKEYKSTLINSAVTGKIKVV